MSGVDVSVCPACGWRGFPQRLWCPRCGAYELGTDVAERGVVRDATLVHRAAGRPRASAPTPVGTVLVEGGVAIVARLEQAAVGDAVRLVSERGAVVARHATCNDAG